ncbi:MAG TPA: hypothetical protein DCE41_13625 [Cytophagales bacterium]|nr:hypothetical protein [Cytophagales bacterium]HAA17718.1 hypothetical protein [Cytophagales bacterium]HAP60016.1 hypothetical protein [Cytophagales bacterium]
MASEIILQVHFDVSPGQLPLVEVALRELENDYFSYLIKDAEHQLFMKVQTTDDASLAETIRYIGPPIQTLDSITERVSLVAVGPVSDDMKTAIAPFDPQYISMEEYNAQYQGMMAS